MSRVDLADYGFLSDCMAAALVSRQGSIDWWAPPRFDAPSVFGRLLDDSAGHWTLGPRDPGSILSTHWSYVDGGLVLRTRLTTVTGVVDVTDALALEPGAEGHEIGLNSPQVLLRQVTGVEGTVDLSTEAAPRLEYGRVLPYFLEDGDAVLIIGGSTALTLRANVPLDCGADRVNAEFTVRAGDSITFQLEYHATYAGRPTSDGPADRRQTPASRASIDATIESWRSWSDQHTSYDGRFRAEVLRSAVVLQGLTYQRSGAVVAAATTSLPEVVGGDRNYDYRFAWLRDFALTMRALWVASCPDETDRLLDWVARSAGQVGDEPVPIMYGVEGERDLTERELPHLRGYADSAPVRVGNEAWRQRQLDVLGEVVDAAYLLREELDDISPESRELLVALANQAAESWREPDAGMWEARDKDRHYVSSKVLCWVALDRAVRMVDLLGAEDSREQWESARDEVHATVLAEGWNEEVGAFTGAFGSDELDASVLIMSLVGFLPGDDPKVLATIHAIEAGLGADGPAAAPRVDERADADSLDAQPGFDGRSGIAREDDSAGSAAGAVVADDAAGARRAAEADGGAPGRTGDLLRRWKDEPTAFLTCTFWLSECYSLAGDLERAAEVLEGAASWANDLGLFTEGVDFRTGERLGNLPQAICHVGLVNAAWRLTAAERPDDDGTPQAVPPGPGDSGAASGGGAPTESGDVPDSDV